MSPCGVGWWISFQSMILITWIYFRIWPVFAYAEFKQGWWVSFPLFWLSSEYIVSWWCSNKLRNCEMIFTFYISTNFPCSSTCLVILPWSAEWLNLGWLFALLVEYLQGFLSLHCEGLFEPLAKYFRTHVTFSFVHCSNLDFKIFILYFYQDSNAALFSIWYLFDIFDTPPFPHTQHLHISIPG